MGGGGRQGGGLVAHVLWNGYASGKWLDWEHLPGFMTRKLAKSVGRRIVEEVKERCKRRRSKHVMFMWGNDNRFIQAGNQFAAMDQVITALQEMKDETGFDARYRLRGCEVYFSNGFRVYFSRASGFIDALHSTPSHYFAAVEEERRVLSSRLKSGSVLPPPLAVVRGGFMPYCDGIGDPPSCVLFQSH